MNRSFPVLVAACLCPLLWAAPALGAPADPWFGRDKALHFGASFALAVGGYAGASLVFDDRGARVTVGSAFALTAGVAKEVADAYFGGDPSYRDLTWDVLGTAAGTLVAWALDHALLVHRAKRRRAAAPSGPFDFAVTSQCAGAGP